ncbi:ATP-grasp domain-containing protein [Terrihabitans soli]|uniref:carboxylate--amine ligase n=1 Tax=Terrihabitans soli TaxID=708113 RepID=UPI001CEC3575|nr:ATP-grasp domain-containing protein [Terrihabitans soli]
MILGGAHGAIAMGRCLRGRGIPVWQITDETRVPSFSRYILKSLRWSGAEDPAALQYLLDLANESGLNGYVLLGAGDAEVKLISQNFEALSRVYRLPTTPWAELSFACDKAKAYRRAQELGIGVPEIYNITSVPAAEAATLNYPVVLKPSMRIARNPLTLAKAWRADDRETFLALYRRAASYVGGENVVVQELVPGGGETQLSYTGLWSGGHPVAEFAARRLRQQPVEFGTGTFVDVVDAPDVIELGRKFLASIHHNGLVEIEFKRDPRSGQLKLVDVNPRLWTWFGIAEAAGVDYGPLLYNIATGTEPVIVSEATSGTAWMYLPRDLVASIQMMLKGALSPGDYLASLGKVRTWALFSTDDPLPALVDIPLGLLRVATKWFSLRRN